MIKYLKDSNNNSTANDLCKTCLGLDASNIKTLEMLAEL